MQTVHASRSLCSTVGFAACVALLAAPGLAAAADEPFLPLLINSSTIPANGDLNPYGVAFVPHGFPSGGTIAAGDVWSVISIIAPISRAQGRRSFSCIRMVLWLLREAPSRSSRAHCRA